MNLARIQRLGVVLLSVVPLLVAACASGPTNEAAPDTLVVEVSNVTPMNESLDNSAIEVTLELTNLNDEALGIEQVNYRIDTGDLAGVIEGSVESGEEIGTQQTAELKFKESIPFPEQADAYQAVLEKREIPLTLEGTLSLSNGETVPFQRATSVATPTLPKMVINDVQAARYGREGVDVTMFLRLVNENMFSVLIQAATYTVTIQGKEVRTEQAGVGVRLVAGSAQEFSVNVILDESSFDKETIKQVLESGNVTYKVAGNVELNKITVPFEYNGDIKLASGE